jgi:hypothetical protein
MLQVDDSWLYGAFVEPQSSPPMEGICHCFHCALVRSLAAAQAEAQQLRQRLAAADASAAEARCAADAAAQAATVAAASPAAVTAVDDATAAALAEVQLLPSQSGCSFVPCQAPRLLSALVSSGQHLTNKASRMAGAQSPWCDEPVPLEI